MVNLWTSAEDELLIKLWKEGTLTTSRIADKINSVYGKGRTKNSVIGRINSMVNKGMDLERRLSPIKPGLTPTKVKAKVIELPQPRELPRDSECHWIGAKGLYCKERIRKGSSYCEHHHAMVYVSYNRPCRR